MSDRFAEVKIPGLTWSAGAPDPFLVSSEQRTLFAFIPPELEISEPSASGETYRVAEFVRCVSVRFGFPNDEALSPWFERGIAFYAVNEAAGSEWLEEVRAIERQHPKSGLEPFATTRHWVLTFHDSTLEALADGVLLHGDFNGRQAAVEAMVRLCDS